MTTKTHRIKIKWKDGEPLKTVGYELDSENPPTLKKFRDDQTEFFPPDNDYQFVRRDGKPIEDPARLDETYTLFEITEPAKDEEIKEYTVTLFSPKRQEKIDAANITDPPTPADELPKAQVIVKMGKKSIRLTLENSAKDTTLEALRNVLAKNSAISMKKRHKFKDEDGNEMSGKEAKIYLPALDRNPTTQGETAVFKVNINLGETSGTPVTVAPVTMGTGVTITNDDRPSDPGDQTQGVDFGEFQEYKGASHTFGKLAPLARLAVAKNVKLFSGFTPLDYKYDAKTTELTDDWEDEPLIVISETPILKLDKGTRVEGRVINKTSEVEMSGYSLMETEINRSFNTKNEAEAAWLNTGAARVAVEYSSAQLQTEKQQTWWHTLEFRVPYATLFVGLDAGLVGVNDEFLTGVEKLQLGSPDDFFQFLRKWGALLAKEVIVGGTLIMRRTKTFTDTFETAKERLAVEASAKQDFGNITASVSSGNEAESSDMMREVLQEKNSFAVTRGGDRDKINYPQRWMSSVGDSSKWAILGRKKIVPIYEVLDEENYPLLREKFRALLTKIGKDRWNKEDDFKWIDFQEYTKPLRKGLDDLL